MDDMENESRGHQTLYANLWKEVIQRVNVVKDSLIVNIKDNDDPSVLILLTTLINEGVSVELMSCQYQIEQIHNAIVNNPTKGNRVQKMRRLETLSIQSLEPRLNINHVLELTIPDATDFTISFPNLKFIALGNPTKKMIEQVRLLPHLEYLTIYTSLPPFTLFGGFNALETLTLSHLASPGQITQLLILTAASRYINIHVVGLRIPEFIAVLFKTHHVQCTNVLVLTPVNIDYKHWKKLSS